MSKQRWRTTNRILQEDKNLGWKLLVLVSLGFCFTNSAWGDLPDKWQELGQSDFLKEIESLEEKNDSVLFALREDIGLKAKELLTNNGLENAQSTAKLLQLAAESLSEQERAELLKNAPNFLGQIDDKSFEGFRLKAELAGDLGSASRVSEMTEAWLQGKDLSSLNPQQLAWAARSLAGSDLNDREFRLRWEGSLKPPQAGTYEFSSTPFELSFVKGPMDSVEQVLNLKVGEEEVLNKDKKNGLVEMDGTSQELTAEFSYKRVGADASPTSPPVATLFWKGPGIPRSIVPSSVLSTTDGSGSVPGLSLTAVANVLGKPVEKTLSDSNVDSVWLGRGVVTDSKRLGEVLQTLWSRCNESDYLSECKSSAATAASHPLLIESSQTLAMLSSEQQKEWLRSVASDPELTEHMSWADAVELYSTSRFADPDAALASMGTWMSTHADGNPEFTLDFVESNRRPYRKLAKLVRYQYAEHEQLLEDRYLLTNDGSCCLPAAYTLTYTRFLNGELKPWIASIDAKLDDEDLGGDKRASWLIALAMAKEFTYSQPMRFRTSNLYPVEGERYLRAAVSSAETDKGRLQAYKEIVVRYAGVRDLDQARKIVEEAEAALRSSEAREELAAWKDQLKQLDREVEKDRIRQRSLVKQIYGRAIRDSLKQSKAIGDDRATERYKELIEANNTSSE